jgi:hypothetical protein
MKAKLKIEQWRTIGIFEKRPTASSGNVGIANFQQNYCTSTNRNIMARLLRFWRMNLATQADNHKVAAKNRNAIAEKTN